MKFDPDTPEGRQEIERRLKKRKLEANSVRERAERNLNDEPSGKLTNPSEIDRHRDRKDHE